MSHPAFDIRSTALPGCLELSAPRQQDERGSFVKVFHRDAFAAIKLHVDFPEVYYSVSQRDVVRGLHFQTPPAQHAKLVYCPQGRVRDAVLDLRAGSPTFGQHFIVELSSEAANMLYIPPGLAHGFRTLSDTAIMVYHVSSQYSPEHDQGILWNSAGIAWGIEQPTLSDRDAAHPALADFVTPFRYEGEA